MMIAFDKMVGFDFRVGDGMMAAAAVRMMAAGGSVAAVGTPGKRIEAAVLPHIAVDSVVLVHGVNVRDAISLVPAADVAVNDSPFHEPPNLNGSPYMLQPEGPQV